MGREGPEPLEPSASTAADHGVEWIDLARIAVAGLAAFCLWFVEATFLPPGSLLGVIRSFIMKLDPWPSVLLGQFPPTWLQALVPVQGFRLVVPFSTYAAVGLLFSGWPMFKEAFQNVLQRRMTMELSMTIAILAAAYTAHFFVAMIITFFVSIAELLERLALERGRRSIRELLEFLPREAKVIRAGKVVDVKTEDLAIGETVLVAPGGLIAIDGIVTRGQSFADESRITGESMPVEKLVGARVFAGSINQSGVLEVQAERIGADTSYGKIIEAVERAESSRAPVTRLADQLAGYIILFAVTMAVGAQWRFGDVDTSISVLVVAGACGVAAGTPLAILGAIGQAARLGAIVKGGVHMETLSRVDTVVFDKTGTLTIGTPQVTSVDAAEGTSRGDLLAAAASAEFGSEHPLGKAIIEGARAEGVEIIQSESFAYTPGRGIAATVAGQPVLVGSELWLREHSVEVVDVAPAANDAETRIFVGCAGRMLGVIGVADTVRAEAREAIAAIQQLGIRTLLLTGDNARVGNAIGRALAIGEVESELLPEQKVERIRRLVDQGRIVAMVGDGVNDAPALAAANVGIAMGSGTDVTRESADVVLLGNHLGRFAETLKLAHWTNRIIWQNFAGTILIGLVGIALAFLRVIGPIIAVQIHTFSELLFILNSTRVMVSVGSDLRSILDSDPLLRRLFLSTTRGQAGAASSNVPSPSTASTGKVQKMINLYALRPAWTPVTILVMILGLIVFWPLGLIVIAYIIWGNQIPTIRNFFATINRGVDPATKAGPSGNVAFEEYREAALKRLEEERAKLDKESQEFESYIHDLRRARDQEEFERFRRERPSTG
jgi:Cd2+/Zn2+-exporting ATPase/Cu+-exporting ATPase